MTVARAGSVTTTNGSGTTIASASYSQTAGRHISACFSWEHGGGPFVMNTVTDTAGNTYVRRTVATDATEATEIWDAVAPCLGNASNVITGTLSGSVAFSTVQKAEYSTTLGATAFAGRGGGTGSNTHPVTSAAFTAGDFAVGSVKNFSGLTTSAVDSGWSSRDNSAGSGVIDRIDSPGGTYTAGATYGSATDWAIQATSYTEVSSGSFPPVPESLWGKSQLNALMVQ